MVEKQAYIWQRESSHGGQTSQTGKAGRQELTDGQNTGSRSWTGLQNRGWARVQAGRNTSRYTGNGGCGFNAIAKGQHFHAVYSYCYSDDYAHTPYMIFIHVLLISLSFKVCVCVY